MTEKSLSMRGVSKSFASPGRGRRSRQVLHDVDLTVSRGEIVALVGESGSGKSTVARIFARLISPDSGVLSLEGSRPLEEEPFRASRSYRKRVQMVFQDPFGSLNPAHPVAHHLERPLALHGSLARAERRRAAIALLEEVGLAPAETYIDRHPHALSGGQRQRVAIARALATDPDYLLADEPTSMLDVATRRAVLELLRDLAAQRNLGVLFVTHDLLSARHLADRTLVMYAGRIVERGPTKAVLGQPGHPYTALLLSARPGPNAGFRDPPPAQRATHAAATSGCAFAPRCTFADESCRAAPPDMTRLDVHHDVRCFKSESFVEAS